MCQHVVSTPRPSGADDVVKGRAVPNKTRGTHRNVTNVTRTSRFPRVGDAPRRQTAEFEPPGGEAVRAPGSVWQIEDQDGPAIDRSAMVLPSRFDGVPEQVALSLTPAT